MLIQKNEGEPATMQGTQSILDNSTILYIDQKNRTNGWLSRNQLQLPFRDNQYGSIGRVSPVKRDVNGNFSADGKTQEMPEWKRKQQEHGKASVEVNPERQNSEYSHWEKIIKTTKRRH